MSYASGQTILDAEYNGFATTVNGVLGVGVGQSGHGETTIAAVSAGTTISATQWSTLLNKVSLLSDHQGTAITAITNPVSTNTIAILTALNGNINLVTGTNRFNAAGVGTTITAGGAAASTKSWNGSVDAEQVVTWTSANAKRYFFNAGGRVEIKWTRTGGAANSKNTGWTNLLTACGEISMTGDGASKTIAAVAWTGTTKKIGSGSTNILLTGTGADDLTTGYVNVFRQYDATALYTANYITLAAKSTTTTLTLKSTMNDDADANTDESPDGTWTATVKLVNPSTTYLTANWGTAVLSAPNLF